MQDISICTFASCWIAIQQILYTLAQTVNCHFGLPYLPQGWVGKSCCLSEKREVSHPALLASLTKGPELLFYVCEVISGDPPHLQALVSSSARMERSFSPLSSSHLSLLHTPQEAKLHHPDQGTGTAAATEALPAAPLVEFIIPPFLGVPTALGKMKEGDILPTFQKKK